MAVRYPLIIDATDNNKIKELPANDSLNLSTNSIVNAVNITASGTLTVASLVVDSSSVTINGTALATVATTNSYTDLSNKPTLFDGQYSSLTGRPTIPTTTSTLADVGSTAPTNGQALIYNSALGRYEPGNLADVSIDLTSQSIGELSDVVTTSPSLNQILKWNGAAFVNAQVDFSELTGANLVVEQGDTFTGSVIGDTNGYHTGDVTGSIFADNSTLLVDAVNGEIPAENVIGTFPTLKGSVQEIIGPGVINTSTLLTEIITTGTDSFTLANGTYGQIKIICKLGGASTATIIPATFANGTSIEFNANNDNVTMIYTNSGWMIIAGQSYTVNP